MLILSIVVLFLVDEELLDFGGSILIELVEMVLFGYFQVWNDPLGCKISVIDIIRTVIFDIYSVKDIDNILRQICRKLLQL